MSLAINIIGLVVVFALGFAIGGALAVWKDDHR